MNRLPDRARPRRDGNGLGSRLLQAPSLDRLRSVAALLGGYAFLGGLITLLGWITGIDRLKDWEASGITMKANTAVASAAAGASLMLVSLRPSARSLIRGLSALVIAIAALTLLQHLTGWDLGIDTLLFDEAPGARATAAPGRMGLPASTSFLVLGIATFLLTWDARPRNWSVYLGIIAAAIASLSLTGHFYGADLMFSIPRLTGIAAQTASFILALALGVIACVPEHDPVKTALDRGSAGMLIRRVVPFVVLVPFGLGSIRVWIQEAGLVDTAFGTALRTITEVGLFIAMLWSAARSVQRHERALFENRELLKTTLQSIGAGVVTTNANGAVTYLNAVAETLSGWTNLQADGKTLQEVFPIVTSTPANATPDLVSRALSCNAPVTFADQEIMICGSGIEIPVDVTAAAIRDEEGKATGCVLVFRDATNRRNAERALRSHAEELERRVKERTAELQSSNEQLEAFVYSIAHDLRAPLRTMASFSQLLVEDHAHALDETGKDFLRRIKEGSEFMDRLLLDLLAYGQASQAEIRLDVVDVQKALDSARTQLSSQILESGARIAVSGSLPRVRAHEATLTQCLANLLSNSMKFVAPGVTPSIVISAGITEQISERTADKPTEGERLRLWFCDNGIGIAAEHQDRVFKVFERLYGARYPGTGIGLSIVRKGVERMGGRVGMHSKPGEGCRFWIELTGQRQNEKDGSVGSTNTEPS